MHTQQRVCIAAVGLAHVMWKGVKDFAVLNFMRMFDVVGCTVYNICLGLMCHMRTNLTDDPVAWCLSPEHSVLRRLLLW